jgi:hypothetical protein
MPGAPTRDDLLTEFATSTSAAQWVPDAEARKRRGDRHMRLRMGQKVDPLPVLPPIDKPRLSGRTHLVIPDSHCDQGVPNHRFEWLGRMVTDLRPDTIVDIGDWWSMTSLNRYDKRGSRSFEGRRYWADIDIGVDAQERFRAQLDDYNRGKRKANRYTPRLVRCLGNHENRINRLVDEEPLLEDVISTRDLLSAEFGWEEYPFLEKVLIDGICYSHYFVSGIMGRAIGGLHIAHSMLTKQFVSCVQGHSHLFDYSERAVGDGRRIIAIAAGCYFEHPHSYEPIPVTRMLRRGLLVLKNIVDGCFDMDWWSIERVRARYG